MLTKEDVLQSLAKEVLSELRRAQARFPPFNSAHEGYSVILEKMDELWEAVKGHDNLERTSNMRKEAVQLAAMAIRFLFDVTDAP